MPKTIPTDSASSVWIFQGNPDVFDLDAYLAEGSGDLTWEVNQNRDRINDGDTVFLWRSVSRSVRAGEIIFLQFLLAFAHIIVRIFLSLRYGYI